MMITAQGLQDVVRKAATPNELIRLLAEAVPHCHPTTSMSEREIWIQVGKRDLVANLNEILKQLEEEERE